ncbi:dicer-like protein 4 [Senna tora]|uniref:Dicer-like protein 4 n=1 Tax=Senna tora TaxID=362788 RepID=A0A834X848_9FABA|nr:dicer-like protein 4 [Senna tora]
MISMHVDLQHHGVRVVSYFLGASSEGNLSKSINSLELMLDSKVYSITQKEELEAFVASPLVRIYDYGPTTDGTTSLYMNYYAKLGEIKCQCIQTLKRSSQDHLNRRNTKKILNRMHENVVFSLGNLGIWGALQIYIRRERPDNDRVDPSPNTQREVSFLLTWLELKGSARVLDLALVALVWCAAAVGTDVVGGRQQDRRRR